MNVGNSAGTPPPGSADPAQGGIARTIYELRFFNARGRIGHRMTLACDSDDAALDRAALVMHPRRLELWQGERLVWRFEPRFRPASFLATAFCLRPRARSRRLRWRSVAADATTHLWAAKMRR